MNSLLQERLLNTKIRGAYVADDQDVGLIVEYIGSSASGTVEVSSIGDLLFKHGATGSEAADSTIQIGATAGTIDVSNAAGNTFAEVVDHINSSANWRAYLLDVLRTDNSDASTGSLLTMAATQAKVDGGIALYKDTSKVLNISYAVKLARSTEDTDATKESGVTKFSREDGKWSELLKLITKNTYASGTSLLEIYRVNRTTGASVKIASVTGGATTAEQTNTFDDGAGRGLACENNEYLLARMVGSAACTGYINPMGRVI